MDARLDTLTTVLYQVNTCVSCIARRQVHLGGFVESPSPPPEDGEASEDDDDSNDDDDDEDGDANSSSADESSFGYESSHTYRGRVNIGDFC